MNSQQQAAWDVVYTASHCAPGTGLVLTREHALALLEMMPKPPPRAEWWITGLRKNGEPLYSETARTEAERDSFVRSAWGTAGVKRVQIDEREVQG